MKGQEAPPTPLLIQAKNAVHQVGLYARASIAAAE